MAAKNHEKDQSLSHFLWILCLQRRNCPFFIYYFSPSIIIRKII